MRRFLNVLRGWLRKKRPDMNWRLAARLAPRRMPSFRQLRFLGTVLSAKERRLLGILGLVAALSGGALLARAAFGRLSYAPARGGTYTEGIVGSPQLINPLFAPANDVDADLVRLLYAGLLRANRDGALEPDLAARYEVSRDGKTHTLEIRENLIWSDGTPLTLDDVIFTFDAIKNHDWKSPLGAAFRGVSVERKGERGVVFTLSDPFAAFVQALTVGILPAHVWADVPPEAAALAEFNVKPIGAGPFRFKSFTRDRVGSIKTYVVERNDNYHDAVPYLDRVILKFFPDFDTAFTALSGRQVDGVGFLPLDARRKLAGRSDLAAYRLALPQLSAVFFNLRGEEIFKDVKVRRALALAADRERVLSEALQGEGELLAGPLPDGVFPGVASPPLTPRDLGVAVKLLDEAGWKVPLGGTVREKITRDKKGRVTASSTLAFALTTVDRSETVAAARVLLEDWRAIGAQVELKTVSASRIQKDVIRPRDYEALLYGEVLSADPDPYPFWHSSQAAEGGLNLSGYANRDADNLLAAARAAQDVADRAKKYTEFQKLVAADAPAVFLYRPFYTYLLDRGVRGVNVEHVATPSDRWNGLRFWYRKQRPTFQKTKN